MGSFRSYSQFATSLGFLVAASPAIAQLGGSGLAVVVNAASFERNRPLAPGSIAAAFGQFAAVQQTTAPPGQPQSTLGNARVTVGGTAAGLVYASASQINFVVPASVEPGTAKIVVFSGQSIAAETTVQIEQTSPAIFLRASEAARPGLFLDSSGAVVNAENRARKGSNVFAVVTGIGDDANTRALGAMMGLSRAESAGTVRTGMAGVWLVQLRVPESLERSGETPVALYVNETESNTVSLWVQ